jgi:hypothetical protein
MVGRRSLQPKSARPRTPSRPRPKGPAGPPLRSLVLVPAVLTLAVTLLRLMGELLEWSPRLFSRAPGGGLAIVGIAWLVPIVGLYLGARLHRARVHPPSLVRAAGLPLVALALVPILAFAAARADLTSTALAHLSVWSAAAVVSVGLAFAAWPALGRPLLAYAVLARLPVVGVMWAAIRWGWGTHYDAALPGFPALAPTSRWLWTGVLPQLTIWVCWTVVVGALFGALGWYLAARRAA